MKTLIRRHPRLAVLVSLVALAMPLSNCIDATPAHAPTHVPSVSGAPR